MINKNSHHSTVSVLIIGNEVLSGRTQDSNIRTIARRLADIGAKVQEARVVPDDEQAIVDAVNALRMVYDYVITTGGIGPTHDDITAASIARAFNVPLDDNEEAKQRLLAHYGAENLTPVRLRMARIPRGSTLLDNPLSAAPGFRHDNVFVLAGVPAIMQAMLEHVVGQLRHSQAFRSIGVRCSLQESIVAEGLAAIAQRWPELSFGSYPSWQPGQESRLALVARGTDSNSLEHALAALCELVLDKGGVPEKDNF